MQEGWSRMMDGVRRPSHRLARLLALCAAVGPGAPARAAATYFANNTGDSAAAVADCATSTNSDCTLRDAIQAANANAGADIVTLKNLFTYSLTIGLTGGDDNTTG